MSRVTRPFRNLFWGLLTVILFPFLLIGTFLMMIIMVLLFGVFLCPAGLVLLGLLAVAAVVWVLLAVPSLVFKGDFTWPCQAAQFILIPGDRLTDPDGFIGRATDLFDIPMEFADDVWTAYSENVVGRVEGCS